MKKETSIIQSSIKNKNSTDNKLKSQVNEIKEVLSIPNPFTSSSLSLDDSLIVNSIHENDQLQQFALESNTKFNDNFKFDFNFTFNGQRSIQPSSIHLGFPLYPTNLSRQMLIPTNSILRNPILLPMTITTNFATSSRSSLTSFQRCQYPSN